MADAKTIVTTAAGDVIKFNDIVSKIVVAHPKAASIVFAALGVAAGHFLWQ